jgi:hypothetical protein
MRTKTLALSAVLSALGTASLVAQTNVYSLNAVGYINATMPPGFSLLTCPLIVGTDTEYAPTYNGIPVTNDLNVVLNNDNGQYKNAVVYQFVNGSGFGNADAGQSVAVGGGWAGSTLTSGPSGATPSASQSDIGQGVQLLPGEAVFFHNPNAVGGASMTATFVGTVPQGSLTNIIVPGYSLIASIVPASGDFVANSITGGFFGSTVNSAGPGAGYQAGGNLAPANGDVVEFYDTAVSGGSDLGFSGPGCSVSWAFGSWSGGLGGGSGNPATVNNGGVSQGFFYVNAGKDKAPAQTINGFAAPAGTELWVENFSVNP